MITHQHIDHLGLVEIIASHSGAEVAAIDVVVPFVESFGEDAERDDEFAGGLMLRYGIPEDVVIALRSVSAQLPRLGRAGEGHPAARRRRAARAARPRARGPAPARPQPLRHGLLGRRAADPDRRRPPDRPHLLEPAALAAARRLDERPQALVTYLRLAARDARAAGRDRAPRPRRADHRPRRADRRALRAAPPPRREAAQADRRAAADRLRARPGAVGNVAVTQAFLTLSEVVGHVDLLIDAGPRPRGRRRRRRPLRGDGRRQARLRSRA